MFSTWRENSNNLSMQITFLSDHIEMDTDPNNPMFNWPAHAGDVMFNWLSASDTDYSTVSSQFGFNVPHCP